MTILKIKYEVEGKSYTKNLREEDMRASVAKAMSTKKEAK